ncbi:hypothetical protein DFH09DRAFT_1301395 [Mycena vulgaris]|nr:hypothetical protein DFH09DRAFT_1301395 [Mycena vulgaris]
MSSSSLLLIPFSPPHHPPNANPLLVPEPPLTPTSAPLFPPTSPTAHAATLVDAYAVCGLAISIATDGTLYYQRSSRPRTRPGRSLLHNPTRGRLRGTARRADTGSRGRKCVGPPRIALPGIQLGLDGVNPVDHETIKVYAVAFPLSVGIAGGRPSSSYYFIGVQGNGHF